MVVKKDGVTAERKVVKKVAWKAAKTAFSMAVVMVAY